MPYINPSDYARASALATVPGELNYAMTLTAIKYMAGQIDMEQLKADCQGLVDGYLNRVGISYTNYNNVIGALVCCGFELARRMSQTKFERYAAEAQLVLNRIAFDLYHTRTIPYENQKIEENGDVFPAELFEGGGGA